MLAFCYGNMFLIDRHSFICCSRAIWTPTFSKIQDWRIWTHCWCEIEWFNNDAMLFSWHFVYFTRNISLLYLATQNVHLTIWEILYPSKAYWQSSILRFFLQSQHKRADWNRQKYFYIKSRRVKKLRYCCFPLKIVQKVFENCKYFAVSIVFCGEKKKFNVMSGHYETDMWLTVTNECPLWCDICQNERWDVHTYPLMIHWLNVPYKSKPYNSTLKWRWTEEHDIAIIHHMKAT